MPGAAYRRDCYSSSEGYDNFVLFGQNRANRRASSESGIARIVGSYSELGVRGNAVHWLRYLLSLGCNPQPVMWGWPGKNLMPCC